MSTVETKSIVWNLPSLKWETIKGNTFCTWPHGSGFCLGVVNSDEWRCRYHQNDILKESDDDQPVISARNSWYWPGPNNLTIDLATRHVYDNGEYLGRLNVYEEEWWLD